MYRIKVHGTFLPGNTLRNTLLTVLLLLAPTCRTSSGEYFHGNSNIRHAFAGVHSPHQEVGSSHKEQARQDRETQSHYWKLN